MATSSLFTKVKCLKCGVESIYAVPGHSAISPPYDVLEFCSECRNSVLFKVLSFTITQMGVVAHTQVKS